MRQYYFHGGTRRAALFLSVPITLLFLFFLRVSVALLIGAALCLILSLTLSLILYLGDRPYRHVVATLPEPVLLRDRIYLQFPKGQGGTNACLYVCRHCLYLCAYGRKRRFARREPILFAKIPKQCVFTVEMQEHLSHLRLCFHDRLCYDFLCTREEELLDKFKELGYNIAQKF